MMARSIAATRPLLNRLLGTSFGSAPGETGSGALVRATSPTLVTPTLGAALATSINGVVIPVVAGAVPVILGASAVQVPLTGSTTETALRTVSIPAGLVAVGGKLRVSMLASWPNSANNKTLRIRLGGIAGTIMQSYVATTTLELNTIYIIGHQAAATQVGYGGTAQAPYGATTSALTTGAIDMTVLETLVISGQLASGAETMILQDYCVEYLPPV